MKTIHEIREKEVRAIHKRQCEIGKEQRALGYIKLEKPVRHGWYKEIVITSKVERYKNEQYILEVYKKIEKVFWGRTKKECEKQWLNQVSKNLIYNELPTISKKQYNKLSDKAQKLCRPYQYREDKKTKVRFYVRIPKGACRIKYTRAYITHREIIDPMLESEYAWLELQLLRPGYYEIEQSRYSWKDDWDIRHIKKEKLKVNRKLRQLKNLPVENITKENTL